MIDIYLDEVLLNSDDYISYDYTNKMFEDEFYLGNTSSPEVSLKLPITDVKEEMLDLEVLTKINNNNFSTVYIDQCDVDDDNQLDIKATNKLTTLDVEYDISSIVPITAKNLLIHICSDFNIPFDSSVSFLNDDVVIHSYDSTLTARNYVSMIAEAAGGYAVIDENGYLKIKTYLTGKNKFDKNGRQYTNANMRLDILPTGIKATCINPGNYQYARIVIPNADELLGKTITLQANIFKSGNNSPVLNVYWQKTSGSIGTNITSLTSSGRRTVTLPSAYPTDCNGIQLLFYTNSTGTVVAGDYVEYKDIMLSINNVDTVYEPYAPYAIKSNNLLQFSYEDVDSYKLGDTITIERVVYEFGAFKFETSQDDSLYTLYLDSNNLFLQVMNETQLQNLASNILGFSFTNIEIPTTNKIFGNAETLEFVSPNSRYRILNQFSASYAGGFVGEYETNINNIKEDFTKVIKPTDKINRIKQVVDQNTATLNILSEQTENINLIVQGSQNYIPTEDTKYKQDKTYYLLNYAHTSDVSYKDNTNYYKLQNNNYILLVPGTDYQIGDAIPRNTIYEQEYTELTQGVDYNPGDNIPSTPQRYEAELSGGFREQLTTLESEYQDVIQELGSKANIDIVNNISERVSQTITNTYTKTEIQQIANGTGVDGVKVSATISELGVFDKNGLLIEKTNGNNIISETTGRFNEYGVSVHSVSNGAESDETFFSGYVNDTRFDDSNTSYKGNTIVYTNNLMADGYTIIANRKGRFEKYTDANNHTGVGFFLL